MTGVSTFVEEQMIQVEHQNKMLKELLLMERRRVKRRRILEEKTSSLEGKKDQVRGKTECG